MRLVACTCVFEYPLPAVYIRSCIGNLSPANIVAIFFSANHDKGTLLLGRFKVDIWPLKS